ncbi:aminoglycoside phosphotransferase family protein [Herbidospora sp. RD11066]
MTGLPEWTAELGEVERWSVRPLAGGSVSAGVERITLHLADGRDIHVTRKRAFAHEVAGLAAAQQVRPHATAIPELIASGVDDDGPWLVTPFVSGTPLSGEPPANLFTSLGRLHAHFHAAPPSGLPVVDAAWWRRLCCEWVLPQVTGRAAAFVAEAADHPAVARTLERLPATLLHGDVHTGNVLVDGPDATLIDWGSCRVGPAVLDLANLVDRDSAGFQIYLETAGDRIGDVELGFRWAALQIPVQYLPWTVANLSAEEVGSALDRAERALVAL